MGNEIKIYNRGKLVSSTPQPVQLPAHIEGELIEVRPVMKPIEDGAALAAIQTVSERSTPIQRSVATVIRSGLALVAAGLVAVALWVAGASVAWLAIGFAVLLVGAVVWLVQIEHTYSPTGIERRKADQYASIRHHEIDSNERITLAKLRLYLRLMEGGNHDDH